MSEKHISTTALARTLRKESKELFILLAQGGWILKVDNHWQLTEKGKFEGGIYINHPKYGDYIAWPESVQDHPLLKLLPDAPLSATHLSHKMNVPARLINFLLAERGWIKKHIRGWTLTSRGKILGGEQHLSEQTGIPFVTWPETLLENSDFLVAIEQLTGNHFSASNITLSGQAAASSMEMIVDNWLYVAGVNHACHYALTFGQQTIVADFFLPDLQLCIDVWNESDNAAQLAMQLTKQEVYQKQHYEFIQVQHQTLAELDEFLSKQLMHVGLAVY